MTKLVNLWTLDNLTTEQIEKLLVSYEATHTHEEYNALLEACLSKRGTK